MNFPIVRLLSRLQVVVAMTATFFTGLAAASRVRFLSMLQIVVAVIATSFCGLASASIDATTAVTSLTTLIKSGVTLIQYGLIIMGMISIGYGLMKWKKKGQDNGGDQVEARQIWMPIAAGAAMICLWAVVQFVVTSAGGSTGDIGAVQSF
ncbi:MAG: hypothetical protein EPN79_11010 [Burkholderiaceae bacterium]|nr:MAG: hypothetical protein EPN79_11010 [Burkholderiaceae bacterium]TBR76787.1 MAG: hypothetical protein EPN64_06065 [Burkholderiaceae bacterium]